MITPIKTEEAYQAALARIDRLVEADPEPGTPEADALEVLAVLVEAYERQRYPLALPDPIAAIRFRMEQQGLRQRDLVPYIGSPSRVSEVLSGKRALSLAMIRSLHAGLGIPLEVLVQAPPTAEPPRPGTQDRRAG